MPAIPDWTITELRSHLAGTPSLKAMCDASEWQMTADAVNAETASVVGAMTVQAFSVWLAVTNLRKKIQDHSENPLSELRSNALTIIDLLRRDSASTVDFSDSAILLLASAWLTAGEITQAQYDDLISQASHIQAAHNPIPELFIRQAVFDADGNRVI